MTKHLVPEHRPTPAVVPTPRSINSSLLLIAIAQLLAGITDGAVHDLEEPREPELQRPDFLGEYASFLSCPDYH